MPVDQEQDPLDLLRSRQSEILEQVERIRRKGSRKKRAQSLLGLFTIAASALLGGSLGTSLVTGVGWLSEDVWLLFGATLGVLSAIAAGIQTQNNYAEQAQASFLLAAAYVDLHRAVERYLSLYTKQYENLDPLPQFLGWVDERLGTFQQREAGNT
jgi:hypothetical protein